MRYIKHVKEEDAIRSRRVKLYKESVCKQVTAVTSSSVQPEGITRSIAILGILGGLHQRAYAWSRLSEVPPGISPTLAHRALDLSVTSRGLQDERRRRSFEVSGPERYHRHRARNPPTTHLGFTCLTSRFDLSVRESVRSVKAVILQAYSSGQPVRDREACKHSRRETYPLLVAHVVLRIVLKVESPSVPPVDSSAVLGDLCISHAHLFVSTNPADSESV
jgi:hypothetical protein